MLSDRVVTGNLSRVCERRRYGATRAASASGYRAERESPGFSAACAAQRRRNRRSAPTRRSTATRSTDPAKPAGDAVEEVLVVYQNSHTRIERRERMTGSSTQGAFTLPSPLSHAQGRGFRASSSALRIDRFERRGRNERDVEANDERDSNSSRFLGARARECEALLRSRRRQRRPFAEIRTARRQPIARLIHKGAPIRR